MNRVMNRDRIVKRIKEEMEKQGWSGRALSEQAGLPYYTVSRILTGKSNKLEKLDKIAKALQKPLFYFMDEQYQEPQPVRITSEVKAIYDGNVYREAIEVVEMVLREKDVKLTTDLVDRFVRLIYPKLKNSGKQGEAAKLYAEGLIDYALNTELLRYEDQG